MQLAFRHKRANGPNAPLKEIHQAEAEQEGIEEWHQILPYWEPAAARLD
jgi:hypothetical protein